MKKYTIIGIVILAAIGAFLYWNSQPVYKGSLDQEQVIPAMGTSTRSGSETTSSAATSTSVTPKVNAYTLAEIATHNNEKSCYSAINGNVYDLTTWVSQHPGGRLKILMICGKDGSTLFSTKHGGDEKPETKLATFKIGVLIQ